MDLIELRDGVATLEEYASKTSIEWRKEGIDWLVDEYLTHTGRTPDSGLLERMANTLLHAELTDKRPDKMTLEEYPIMSDTQYERRTEGARRERKKNGVTVREVPLTQARNIGADGKDYSQPIRTYKK